MFPSILKGKKKIHFPLTQPQLSLSQAKSNRKKKAAGMNEEVNHCLTPNCIKQWTLLFAWHSRVHWWFVSSLVRQHCYLCFTHEAPDLDLNLLCVFQPQRVVCIFSPCFPSLPFQADGQTICFFVSENIYGRQRRQYTWNQNFLPPFLPSTIPSFLLLSFPFFSFGKTQVL